MIQLCVSLRHIPVLCSQKQRKWKEHIPDIAVIHGTSRGPKSIGVRILSVNNLNSVPYIYTYTYIYAAPGFLTLHWRHNERDSVSNRRRLHCLLNCWFRRESKKTSKLRITGLCIGNSPVTGEFPAQKASMRVVSFDDVIINQILIKLDFSQQGFSWDSFSLDDDYSTSQ